MIEIFNILDAERYLDGIDAVIFDLDDTLYPEKDYVRSGFRAVAACFPEIDGMFQKLWSAFEAGKPAIDEVLAAAGKTEKKEKALEIYRFHRPEITLYEGVAGMLRRLRSRKTVGIITDGRPEGQRAKLEALGLQVDEVIITDELGGIEFRKPNKAAFQMMQQRVGVPFAKMVYIGDNARKDFIAPRELGMECIHFKNPDGLYNS